ncbi:MAG: hypothetical protein H6625_07095 [Bdellovibrionaceae bacterium]|nr:hypothetical protein [Pseudobdellovibrionaceae bacterium]
MKPGKTKNIFILLIFAILMSACGASKKSTHSSGELASRGTPNTDGSDIDPLSAVEYYALCNSFSGFSLNGSVTTYLNPVTNVYEWDYIRMELKDVPSQIESTKSFYIQFFRWQEDTPGSPYYNSTPVSIYFQFKDGRWLNDKPINSLSSNTIENIISANNLANTTVSNFFDNVVLILSGMSLEYDALMINTYDEASGTTALTTTNVLLPAFAADPNIYAETHSATSLQQLHPNFNIKDSGMNQWQYFQETQNLCGN